MSTINETDIEAFEEDYIVPSSTPVTLTQALWLSGFVQRWHSNDRWELRESGDINGGHCQRVAILVSCIFGPSIENLMGALLHDAPEVLSGDVSAPAKQAVPELGEGDKKAAESYFGALGIFNWSQKTPEVALCDLLDAILFARYRCGDDILQRDDWAKDTALCLDMAAKLGVRQHVQCLINWEWKHGIGR